MAAVAITPFRALLAGGACYGAWSIYMAKYYFQNSSLRKIYVDSDPEFAKVHPMRHPQYDGNLLTSKH
ncbi:hypothetical protein KGF57_002836 [Candida theae]|uniref:Uncharacterized protein n=1 Tax=Candida theae TaxID=1198502 RepID=A0AAD5BE88_9ASCO|nr:uncharacterized protein KGF57_002836 [Candida theae]KAI5958028.1 hypothetical protein KGF57_002836 [Candida theae]